jgi:hypothetical protein
VRRGAGAVAANAARVATKGLRRRGALLFALLVPMFLALGIIPASANNGTVTVGQDCRTWHASVVLNHNVKPDRTVDVVTTIPGTTGITGGHYNTSFGEIWSAGGAAPAKGTVTLRISLPNGHLEFTESKALPAPAGCVTTTSSPRASTTTASSTTTTLVTQGSTLSTTTMASTTTVAPTTTMASTTTTTLATAGSTLPTTTAPTVTTSTMPSTTTVNASGNVVTTSTRGHSTVTAARAVGPTGTGRALPLTGGGGTGPLIGLASVFGGAVMLLVSRGRRGRAA